MPRTPITVSFHENAVPSFAWDALDRLYGARYSSSVHFRIYGLEPGACTYIARLGGEVCAVFLFRRRAGCVTVLNEGMLVGSDQAGRFAHAIFERYRAVTLVRWKMVEQDGARLPLRSLHCLRAQEAVLSLPALPAQYLDSLGPATRVNLGRYRRALLRDFPDFRFSLEQGGAASEQHLRQIVRFNRSRMRDKNKVSSIDALEEERVIACARQCGLVGIITIDARLCAGMIVYRPGRDYCARILAHDGAFDRYHVGMVCAVLTICACIAAGGAARFYFGWGMDEYKRRLGGRARELGDVLICRSWLHLALHPAQVGGALLSACQFHARRAVLALAQRGDGALSVLAGALILAVRRLRARKSRARAGRVSG
jgi:hypothetical protein